MLHAAEDLSGKSAAVKFDRLVPDQTMKETNSRLKRQWVINRLGIVVLLLGLVSASAVYLTGQNRPARQSTDQQAVDSESRDDTLSFEDSKTSSRGTEMYFGKVGVLLSTWLHYWEELEDSQRSAVVIAMSSAFAASICFLVAHRLR
jgi:hypothetical protein